jgi:hypothetical protein
VVGDVFRCIAYTDLDDDDLLAIWWKTGRFLNNSQTFSTGSVHQVQAPEGDDW